MAAARGRAWEPPLYAATTKLPSWTIHRSDGVVYLSLIWLPRPGTHLGVPNSAHGEGTLWPGDVMSTLQDRFGQTRAG